MSTKDSPNSFSFIIPTLSNREGLDKVLEDIESTYPKSSVVVVNNSGKELVLRKFDLAVEVIDEGRNTGFAKASNDGAEVGKNKFKSKYLIFLNDDVEFKSPWVEKCIDKIEKDDLFAASPVLKQKNGAVENAGYRIMSIGKVQLNKNIEDKNIDGLSATALVVNASSFEKLRGFDEGFFAYLEDVDLFLRAKKAGYRFSVVADSQVFHAGQETSSKFKTKKAWLDFKNWIRVIRKNWNRQELQKNFLPILVERGRNLFGVIKSLF